MSMTTTITQITRNALLAALPPDYLEQLLPQLEVVELASGEVLSEYRQPVESVYFPLTCVLSVLSSTVDNRALAVATIGREGMSGLPVLLGTASMLASITCQVPGLAARMPGGLLRREIAGATPLRDVMNRFAMAYINMVSQGSACNRVHKLEQRCACWLLVTHDRVGSDTFPLSKEFLGSMVGVGRSSVGAATASLQRSDLIRYGSGTVEVTDRAGLEAASCECYALITSEYQYLPG